MGHRVQATSLALLLLYAAPLQAADAAQILEQIRAPASLQPGGAVLVENVTVDAGLATLHLDHGVLFPAAPVGGRPAEIIFLGQGRIWAEPPDRIERRQLELFTGEPLLDASFQEAALVVAGRQAVEALLGGRPAAAPDNALLKQAKELFATWRASSERRHVSPDGSLFLNAVGDPVMDRYFVGWFRDAHRGDFMYLLEPDEFEQVTLGQFVAWEVNKRTQRKLRGALHSQQSRGRFIGVELADLGTWDTWISTPLLDKAGDPAPAAAPFEPQHYEIDAALGKDQQITARVRVRLQAMTAGRRGVRMVLFPDLLISAVRDGDGGALPFLQDGADVIVVLPESSDPAREFTLDLEYGGTLLGREGGRVVASRTTNLWYPRLGTVDRATYDVTLHYPAKYDLLGSGRRLEQEKQGKLIRERRTLDYPASNFSFEIGVLDTVEGKIGDIDLTVAFDRQSRNQDPEVRQQIVATIKDAMEFYSSLFGPYPLDYLTVVVIPRDFSQGFLGFVTLSDSAMANWGVFGVLLQREDRRALIAHEIAHQWWGNLIGWRSYRDQWLSEAMADHAALLFTRQWVDGKRKVTQGPLSGAKRALSRRIEDGRTVESLGPVVLGLRLRSSLYGGAYQPIVYQKGAMVLDTLSRIFREDVYLQMLREITKARRDQTLSTEEFLGALAHMSDTNLDSFAERFVYGTGLPQVDYTYEFREREPGGWEVRGQVTQRAEYRLRYKLVEAASGFDVIAERIDIQTGFQIMVPFQILAEPGPDAENQEQKLLVHGRLGVRSEGSSFSVDIDYEPINFWLDKEGEAPARFSCESRRPKEVRMRQGIDLAASGEVEPAEAAFHLALESPRTAKVKGPGEGEKEEEEEGESTSSPSMDARIHLHLANLYLDHNRDEDAARELGAAEQLMKGLRWSPEAMALSTRNRVALRQGDYGRVYRRLRKIIIPGAPRAYTDDLIMLAVAAQRQGHKNEATKALDLAQGRGADVALLLETR